MIIKEPYLFVFPLCNRQVSSAKLTFDRILVEFALKTPKLNKTSNIPQPTTPNVAHLDRKNNDEVRQYKILYPHRPHEQQVDGECGDEEARGQVEELGALIDQTCRVSNIDKSKHQRRSGI